MNICCWNQVDHERRTFFPVKRCLQDCGSAQPLMSHQHHISKLLVVSCCDTSFDRYSAQRREFLLQLATEDERHECRSRFLDAQAKLSRYSVAEVRRA